MPRARTSHMDITSADAARYMSRIQAVEHTTCMRWSGRTRVINGWRYAIFDMRGAKMARTVGWILAGKGDPPLTGITMGCGNDWCMNPEHMRPADPRPPLRWKTKP